MLPNNPKLLSAMNDFNNARRKASIQDLLALLGGKSNELLSYDEVAEKLKLNVRSEKGTFDIPLKAIVGSVGRYNEFTRGFMPRKNDDRQRWATVKAIIDDPSGNALPPIEVYKVGDSYFVLDGNHRVSVAREEGFEFIEAHVIEVKTDIPLRPDTQPDDLIIKAEYAEFLARTEINTIRPGVNLSVSVPGQYSKLLEHIQVHQYYMGLDFKREIPYPEAVGHWFDNVYMTTTEPIRERGLLRWFPDRTETDMYLWVSAYRTELENELGWSIRPEAAAEKLAVQVNPINDLTDTGRWRTAKMFDRYTDRLFGDILVPLTGKEQSWQALEQSIILGKKEASSLHGLHILATRNSLETDKAKAIQDRFLNRCKEAGLQGSLMFESGNVANKIIERSLLTDLIVLFIAHPPDPGISSLRSGLRSIIWRSARPILTISRVVSPMDNTLLAFDGSPKSKEALFVATYLAEKCCTKLTVLTISDADSREVQDYARKYLDLHEIEADYVVKKGTFEIFTRTIEKHAINLVLIGGYSGTPLTELIAGSAVNYLLRSTDCSLLICH